MRQIIPFKKDITFKTKIGEITSISLDNDLILKGEDLISGSFYISGSYKMLEASTIEETYSYKIPCEIAISDEYDTFDATVDIDDFNYEVIDDEVLRINIVVAIDNLKKREVIVENDQIKLKDYSNEIKEIEEAKDREKEKSDSNKETEDRCIEDEDTDSKETASFMEMKESIKNQNDTYLTYKVYIFKEGDSIDSIIEKYGITKDDLEDYNDLSNIVIGSKLVIPDLNA